MQSKIEVNILNIKQLIDIHRSHTLTSHSGKKTVRECLSTYYEHRVQAERGALREELKKLLPPAGAGRKALDAYSFITIPLQRSVFKYFVSQVRSVPDVVAITPRIRDREDRVSKS